MGLSARRLRQRGPLFDSSSSLTYDSAPSSLVSFPTLPSSYDDDDDGGDYGTGGGGGEDVEQKTNDDCIKPLDYSIDRSYVCSERRVEFLFVIYFSKVQSPFSGQGEVWRAQRSASAPTPSGQTHTHTQIPHDPTNGEKREEKTKMRQLKMRMCVYYIVSFCYCWAAAAAAVERTKQK